MAGLYLKIIAASIPGFAAFENGKRFLQAQGLFQATIYVLLVTVPFNVFTNWFLVWYLGFKFVGAPIVTLLPKFLTDNKVIKLIASTIMPVITYMQIFNYLVVIANGLLRGIGK